MSSDLLKQHGLTKDAVERATKGYKVAVPKTEARASERSETPYNPYDDGEVACIWELIRRSEPFLEFEEAVKKLPPPVWCQSFQDLELGVRDVLWSIGRYIEEKPRRLSGKTWRKLPPDLRDELQKIWGGVYWKKGNKVKPRDGEEEAFEAEQKPGRAGASHLESVAVVEGLYDMEPERQRKFLGKMQFAGFVPCFLLKGPVTEGEFREEMKKLWKQLPERMKVSGKRRPNRFGTREQWEKFLVFEKLLGCYKAKDACAKAKERPDESPRKRALRKTIEILLMNDDPGMVSASEGSFTSVIDYRAEPSKDSRKETIPRKSDFEGSIEFIEAWIKVILTTEPPPDPPENKRLARSKKP